MHGPLNKRFLPSSDDWHIRPRHWGHAGPADLQVGQILSGRSVGFLHQIQSTLDSVLIAPLHSQALAV